MEYHRHTLYAKLLNDYVRANEARRTRKSERFVEVNLRFMPKAEREATMRKYNIAYQLANLLAAAKELIDEGVFAHDAELETFDAFEVMSAIQNVDLPGSPSFSRDCFDLNYDQFIRSMKSVGQGLDYTRFSHACFVRAYDARIRQRHLEFEDEPEISRYRFLGPIMASPADAEAYNDLFMNIVLAVVEHPIDPEDFLASYRDAFIDYHIEYVGSNLNDLGICDLLDGSKAENREHRRAALEHLLGDQELTYSANGHALRPICQLSPSLERSALAHVVDYFTPEAAANVARQHFEDHFSTVYYGAPSILF